jgi:hypothetical protein
MDGGKIGGGPQTTPVLPNQPKQVEAKASTLTTQVKTPQDQFEFGNATAKQSSGTNPLAQEKTKGADVLKLARDNPAAARQLVASLAATTSTLLSGIDAERAALRVLLEQLAAKRFNKSELKKEDKKLRQHRNNLRKLKLQLQLSKRKMNLLEQIAGKLGDPRLDSEISRILKQHQKLRSRWGKRHHLLSLGKVLHDAEEETPEHLQRVVQTEVHGAIPAEQLSETLEELSPRRSLSEMMVRTIDGSIKTSEEQKPQQHHSLGNLSELDGAIGNALMHDPWESS